MSAASGPSDVSKSVYSVSSSSVNGMGMNSNNEIASGMNLNKSAAIPVFTPSGNAYLDSLSLKTIEMKNYESFNKTV